MTPTQRDEAAGAASLREVIAGLRADLGRLRSEYDELQSSRDRVMELNAAQGDELDSLKRSVLDLSHPNCVALLKEVAQLREQLDRALHPTSMDAAMKQEENP